MELIWFGQKAIKIKTRDVEIYLDLPLEKIEKNEEFNQVLLYSNNQDLGVYTEKRRFVCDTNGEFEIHGVEAQIIPINQKKVVKIKVEGINLCHLDEFTGDLTQKQQELLNQVDILFISLTDLKDSLKSILNLISKIEPKVVIPIGYKSDDEVRQFFENQGVDPAQAKDSYKVVLNDLDIEERKTILLKAQSL